MKDEILDDFLSTGISEVELAKERKRLWYAIAACSLLYWVIISFIGGPQLFFRQLLNNLSALIVVPILGFLLGLLAALIPYKGMSYASKYLRSSQWSMLIVSIILVFISIYVICIF